MSVINNRRIDGGTKSYAGSVIFTTEDTCARCGKSFHRTAEHAYRLGSSPTRFYCSYTCWRAEARKAEEEASRRKDAYRQRQRTQQAEWHKRKRRQEQGEAAKDTED